MCAYPAHDGRGSQRAACRSYAHRRCSFELWFMRSFLNL